MINEPKNYEDLTYNELLFLMIYHLIQQNYHESIVKHHKDYALFIQDLLNKMETED